MTDASPRVLVVEDNEMNLELTTVLLVRAGLLVEAARTVTEAITAAARLKPDLIVMDLQLPDGSGLDAMRAIRSDPKTAATPIVVLTASAMPEEEQSAWAACCDAYIAKPFDTRTFAAKLREILSDTHRRRS